MRGVVLAGGKGTRLGAFTQRVTNKHLCLVYDKPMIDYPLKTLREAGIMDVTVVTSERSSGDVVRYLGDGREHGFRSLDYRFQFGGDKGIADAIKQAGIGRSREPIAVILGDNLFEEDMATAVYRFNTEQGSKGARCLLKSVSDPERYGVAVVRNGRIVDIDEKPKTPKSSLAITGFYLFDERVFDIIETLKPSKRGEYEVTDILNWYRGQDQLCYDATDKFWTDMGTFDSLLHAASWLGKGDSYSAGEDDVFESRAALG